MMDEYAKPWQVKKLTLYLNEEERITLRLFDDEYWSICQGDDQGQSLDDAWSIEDINLDAARMLRDFLIYAIPDKDANLVTLAPVNDGKPEA